MYIEGNLHHDGAALGRYIMTPKEGERVELAGVRGFSTDDIYAALAGVEIEASQTQCEYPFFHAYLRLAPGEHLTNEQWLDSGERYLDRLGLGDQPYVATFQIDEQTGEKHLHMAVSRIAYDDEKEKYFAIDPGLYIVKGCDLARELEEEFDLRRLSNERTHKVSAPERAEFEESKRLGTDIREIRDTIRDCFERSDNGKSFKAAIEQEEWILSQGDRRDCFVVVNHEGGHHALNKKLTGVTLAETRQRFVDIDREQLPTVDQAKEIQANRRMLEIEKATAEKTAERTAEPLFDRDAAEREWMEKLVEAAIAHDQNQQHQATGGPETPRQFAGVRSHAEQPAAAAAPEQEKKPERELNRIQGEIRLALSLTESGAGWVSALEDRGFLVAEVREQDIEHRDRSELASMLQAKEKGVWMFAKDGVANFTPEQMQSAQVSYEAWKEGKKDPVDFSSYLSYVQERQQERLEELKARADAQPEHSAEPSGPLLPAYAKANDLVVVTGSGQIYILNRRTTGMERDELDKYLAPVDRAALLSVTDTQAVMQEVKAERQAARDAYAAWQVAREAYNNEDIGKTAGEIRLASMLSQSAEGFADALEERGLRMACVTQRNVNQNEYARQACAAQGHRQPAELHLDQFVVTTRYGSVYLLNQRTTGKTQEEIEKYLGTITRDLPGVLQAREELLRLEEVTPDPAYMEKSIPELRELRMGFRETRREVREQLGREDLLPSEREALQAMDGAAREGQMQVRHALWQMYVAEPERFTPENTLQEISRQVVREAWSDVKGAWRESTGIVADAHRFTNVASGLTDIGGNVAEKLAEGIGFLADSFGGGHSVPTPEVIAEGRKARAEKEQATDWKRWAADETYREQVRQQEFERRQQEREYYMKGRRERGLDHDPERER